jgi:glycosyltransferase involved in cell wall biosynthesis
VRPLRVGQFLAHFPAPGGTTTAVRGLCLALSELGHQTYVYAHGRSSASDLPAISLRVFRPAAVRSHDRLTAHLAANRDRLDILILNGMFNPLAGMVARACRRGGIACVADPHGAYGPELFRQRRQLKRLYFFAAEGPFLRGVDAVELHAPSHRRHLERLGVTVPSFVVPWGVPPALLEDDQGPQEPTPARSVGPAGELRVVYLGRFDVRDKGLDLLLEAVAGDRLLRSKLLLRLVGRSTAGQRRALERLVSSLDLGDRVTLSDYTPAPWSAIRSADLLVLPSRFDGFGMVVIEALALGTPVLVSRKAGVSEFLTGQKGVLAVEPDVPGVRAGLQEALREGPDLRAAAWSARPRVRQRFSWEGVARHWLAEVQRLGLVAR